MLLQKKKKKIQALLINKHPFKNLELSPLDITLSNYTLDGVKKQLSRFKDIFRPN